MGKDKRRNRKATSQSLIPLQIPLQALLALLQKFQDRGVIVGGVAASLLGAPRFTVDLDAVILASIDDADQLLDAAASVGIEPRITDIISFARKTRVLLLRHTASGVDIDISLGMLPFEVEMVERARSVILGELVIRLPTPEDLIIMKAVAHRSKDLADIQGVAESHPDLDKVRIKYWVDQFGEALDNPDLWNQISPYLKLR